MRLAGPECALRGTGAGHWPGRGKLTQRHPTRPMASTALSAPALRCLFLPQMPGLSTLRALWHSEM